MSYNAPETPLVSLNTQDEVQSEVPGQLYAFPNSDRNFADDPKTMQWIEANLTPLINFVRDDAEPQHEEWSRIRRMAALVREEENSYQGMSTVFLPVYQKILETKVSHLSDALFPTETYLDGEAVDPQFEAAAPAAKAWMFHQLDSSAKIRAEFKPFLRSLENYGIGIAKVWWQQPPKDAKSARMTRLPQIQDMLYTYDGAKPWSCAGLRFKARSPFSWYAWPTTVNSIEETSLVFEDIQVSSQFANEMHRAGHWKNLDAVLHNADNSAVSPNLEEQLREVHASGNTAVNTRMGELATWSIVTECWLMMPVPDSLYTPNETKGCPVPVKVTMAGGVCIEARRNPFWHQKTPYVMQRLNENTDSLYTVGMGRSLEGVQQLANDFVNQTNDNATYGLNPVAKMNPNVMIGDIEPIEPGRTYNMTDPNGLVFDRPPIEQMQYGLMWLNQMISFGGDFGGAPAQLQGSGAKGGAKTATGSQILQSNVKGEMQSLVKDIEQRVLEPLMYMAHSLGQQYESKERFFAISGGEKIQFTRADLEGEFAWRWVASSQAVNQQMRAQQSIQFAQLAAQMVPLLQAQGQTFDPVPLLRQVWEAGLGNRNFDRLIKPAPPMPGMPPGMAPPGAPGEMPGGEPRSAVEQAPGGSGEMAPGEGEAFNEVRAGADEMAAAQGATYGGGEE